MEVGVMPMHRKHKPVDTAEFMAAVTAIIEERTAAALSRAHVLAAYAEMQRMELRIAELEERAAAMRAQMKRLHERTNGQK